VALFSLAMLGCSSASLGRTEAFESQKHLFASIDKADRILLYEGLPTPWGDESELFHQEKGRPDVVTFRDDLFYSTPLEVREQDVTALKAILGNAENFHAYQENMCDYHADYCVEWSSDGTVYRFHPCFGCNQAKIYTSSGGMWCTMPGATFNRLRELLKEYQKLRPGNPQKYWLPPRK
jgi:hypothetical protein